MHPLSHRRAPGRGFTLIELLTVIAIIGILAAILIPTVSSVRSKAKSIKCASQMRAWAQVVRLCANDNKGNIPISLNLGGLPTDTTGDGKLYTPYFSAVRLDNLGVTDQATIDPMDYFSSCPAVDRTGTVSTATRRSYAFVNPIGSKSVPDDTTRIFGRTVVKGLDYYNIDRATAPSRLFLMMEQIPGATNVGVIKGSNWQSDVTNYVKDVLITGANPSLVRHNGIIQVLYLDGHLSSQRWKDVDVNSVPAPERGAFAIRYTL